MCDNASLSNARPNLKMICISFWHFEATLRIFVYRFKHIYKWGWNPYTAAIFQSESLWTESNAFLKSLNFKNKGIVRWFFLRLYLYAAWSTLSEPCLLVSSLCINCLFQSIYQYYLVFCLVPRTELHQEGICNPIQASWIFVSAKNKLSWFNP